LSVALLLHKSRRNVRKKLDELVNIFLIKLKYDILCMISYPVYYYIGLFSELGLDCNRDTEAEVELAIRTFPENLSNGFWRTHYPLRVLSQSPDSVRSLPFVALLARLGNELDQFDDNEQGGLFKKGGNVDVIQNLIWHCDEWNETLIKTELIKLKRSGLFTNEYEYKYNLVYQLCRKEFFAESIFRLFVEWDPIDMLLSRDQQQHRDGVYASVDGGRGNRWCPPLWTVSMVVSNSNRSSNSLHGFRSVLEVIFRYYPKKKGIDLLFRKSNHHDGMTPFQMACSSSCSCLRSNDDNDSDNDDDDVETAAAGAIITNIVTNTLNDADIKLNVEDAFLIACEDDTIHLDGVYFLLRREPEILRKFLM